MSTHRLILRRQRSSSLPAFLLCSGLLIALQVWLSLSSAAFAADLTPTSLRLVSLPPQDVTRAGVSVVRLVVTYTAADSVQSANPVTVAQCTGLGVIVSSTLTPNTQQSSNTEYTNWVLTDGNLVNPNGDHATCVTTSTHSAAKASNIAILASTDYNPQTLSLPGINIDPAMVNTPNGNIRCLNTICSEGPLLFSFTIDSNHPQPFIDLATAAGSSNSALALTTNDPHKTLPSPTFTIDAKDNGQFKSHLATFLKPNTLPSTSKSLEAGTPLVNANGELTNIHLSSKNVNAPIDEIGSFVKNVSFASGIIPTNPVYDNWKKGMDEYYHSHFIQAQPLFQAASTANPEFTAASTYAALSAKNSAIKSIPTPTASGGTVLPGGFTLPDDGITIANQHISYWLLSLLGLLILILVLFFSYLLMSRSRAKRRFEEELAEANQTSDLEVQRMNSERSSAQQAWDLSAPPIPPAHNYPQPPSLSPADSALHTRVRPPAPPASATPARSLADQPTMIPLPPIAEQPTMVPPPPIADQPTVAFNSSTPAHDVDRTIPLSQQGRGRNLGFVVATRSDPGIKRKYKPNEDSLFAAQGLINPNLTFGLFVVADGMGGHAQGEDASRLAIQMIINYVLPRLKNGPLQGDDYANILTEGVQSANQAVHQHNMDQRGDMGTTVTAALIIDALAYVANVGDSRTYLYRESEGLKKVTNDHSVVASLVEAGIIKPDDIYTHPKRNQIYRSLGEKSAVDIDCFPVLLREGDKLLLCSDGLWDMVRDPKIEEVIKSPVPNPNDTGVALIQAALDGGGEDNVSVIVVHITELAKTTSVRQGIQLLTKPESVQMPPI